MAAACLVDEKPASREATNALKVGCVQQNSPCGGIPEDYRLPLKAKNLDKAHVQQLLTREVDQGPAQP